MNIKDKNWNEKFMVGSRRVCDFLFPLLPLRLAVVNGQIRGRIWPKRGLISVAQKPQNRAQSFLLHWKIKECGSCCLSECCVSRAHRNSSSHVLTSQPQIRQPHMDITAANLCPFFYPVPLVPIKQTFGITTNQSPNIT